MIFYTVATDETNKSYVLESNAPNRFEALSDLKAMAAEKGLNFCGWIRPYNNYVRQGGVMVKHLKKAKREGKLPKMFA